MTDETPRIDPSCETCEWMRREGNTMRCYYDPPKPQFIQIAAAKIAGGPPVLVVAGITPEVAPQRFCRHHPLLHGRSPGFPAESVN